MTQVNNVYVFPGIGLGALAVGATRITDTMFMAAARELGTLDDCASGLLLPPIEHLKQVAVRIARVVAAQAITDGVARKPGNASIDDLIEQGLWTAAYS